MRFTTALMTSTLLTMLTACGGGGGGGYGNVPNTTLPDIPNTPSTTQDNLTTMDYSVSNKEEREGYAITILGESEFNNQDTSVATFNLRAKFSNAPEDQKKRKADSAYRNMMRYADSDEISKIIAGDYDNNEEDMKHITQAVAMAFGNKDIFGMNWIDIINFIKTNKDNFITQAEDIFNRLGDEKTFDISDAKMQIVKLHETKQNSFVNFILNDDEDAIEQIEISSNKGMASELNYSAARDGNKKEFNTKQKIYRYGINTPYYTGTFIESFEELNDEQIQEKLIKRVDELAETGAYDADGISREEITDKIKQAIEVAFNPTKNDGTIDVTSYEGDAKEIEYEYNDQNPQPIPFEYFYMNYDKTEKITYESYMTSDKNKDKKLDLSYSDFGILTKEATYNPENILEGAKKETYVFAGGYDSKRIDAQKLTKDMSFSGYAVGAVNVIYSANQGAENFEELEPLNLNGTVNVEFDIDNGTQTAKASFNNWYDVTATSNADGSNNVLTLNNWKSGTAEDYKFRNQSEYVVNDFTTAKQLAAEANTAVDVEVTQGYHHSDPSYGAFNIGYYGDAGDPKEATGYIYYEESRGFNSQDKELSEEKFNEKYPAGVSDEYYDVVKNISVNIGFGAVKQ